MNTAAKKGPFLPLLWAAWTGSVALTLLLSYVIIGLGAGRLAFEKNAWSHYDAADPYLYDVLPLVGYLCLVLIFTIQGIGTTSGPHSPVRGRLLARRPATHRALWGNALGAGLLAGLIHFVLIGLAVTAAISWGRLYYDPSAPWMAPDAGTILAALAALVLTYFLGAGVGMLNLEASGSHIPIALFIVILVEAVGLLSDAVAGPYVGLGTNVPGDLILWGTFALIAVAGLYRAGRAWQPDQPGVPHRIWLRTAFAVGLLGVALLIGVDFWRCHPAPKDCIIYQSSVLHYSHKVIYELAPPNSAPFIHKLYAKEGSEWVPHGDWGTTLVGQVGDSLLVMESPDPISQGMGWKKHRLRWLEGRAGSEYSLRYIGPLKLLSVSPDSQWMLLVSPYSGDEKQVVAVDHWLDPMPRTIYPGKEFEYRWFGKKVQFIQIVDGTKLRTAQADLPVNLSGPLWSNELVGTLISSDDSLFTALTPKGEVYVAGLDGKWVRK